MECCQSGLMDQFAKLTGVKPTEVRILHIPLVTIYRNYDYNLEFVVLSRDNWCRVSFLQ